jgi:transcriptional regulator with XRE-family HTH domain
MALQQRAMGRRIAEFRERAHMTQEAAADKAGVTLRAYQKWEAGGGIQYANLIKLAEVLHVPVERLTGEESAPDPFQTASQLDRIEAQLADLHALLVRHDARAREMEELLQRIVAADAVRQAITAAGEALGPRGHAGEAGPATPASEGDPPRMAGGAV